MSKDPPAAVAAAPSSLLKLPPSLRGRLPGNGSVAATLHAAATAAAAACSTASPAAPFAARRHTAPNDSDGHRKRGSNDARNSSPSWSSNHRHRHRPPPLCAPQTRPRPPPHRRSSGSSPEREGGGRSDEESERPIRSCDHRNLDSRTGGAAPAAMLSALKRRRRDSDSDPRQPPPQRPPPRWEPPPPRRVASAGDAAEVAASASPSQSTQHHPPLRGRVQFPPPERQQQKQSQTPQRDSRRPSTTSQSESAAAALKAGAASAAGVGLRSVSTSPDLPRPVTTEPGGGSLAGPVGEATSSPAAEPDGARSGGPSAASPEPDPPQRAADLPPATPQAPEERPDAEAQPPPSDGLEPIGIGSRVEIYWDGEGRYYAGTLTERRGTRGDCFYIEYDDGDREWVRLDREVYRLALPPPDDDAVGAKPADASASANNGATAGAPRVPRQVAAGPPQGQGDLATAKRPNGTTPVADSHRAASDSKHVETTLSSGGLQVKQHRSSKKRPAAVVAAAAAAAAVGEGSGPSQGPRRTSGTAHPATNNRSWVEAGLPPRFPDESSDSETDEEELMDWAVRMLGISRPPPVHTSSDLRVQGRRSPRDDRSIHVPISEAVKLGRRRRSSCCAGTAVTALDNAGKGAGDDAASAEIDDEEALSKLRKEQARPLSQAEIRSILAYDMCPAAADAAHWVRRSMRQPSRSALESPQVKALLEKLRANDTDMVVLKMKKYVNDPNAPQLVLDAVLDALEENTNCESLYIQNFNEGMRDAQVLRLLGILQRPSCKIWCLNIGETYKVKTKTWKKFADGLADTKITHMYASEHTITPELKEQIRSTIRDNRAKHTMHCDPENLDTIIQCTHCWWNPINTKSLRPYLKNRGYEHILHDKDLQGLRGSTSASTFF